MGVPEIRISALNRGRVRPDGKYVLYWMTACRRARFNFALERAVEHATGLRKPLLVVEALGCGDRWDTDRHHAFALEGMRDNAEAFRRTAARYAPFVERAPGEGDEALADLCETSCAVIGDEHPTHGLTRRAASTVRRARVLFEVVDSNGLLPLRAAEKVYSTAYSFRRFLQGCLPEHLGRFPKMDPLKGVRLPQLRRIPEELKRDTVALKSAGGRFRALISKLPIDHKVGCVETIGGATAAGKVLRGFVRSRLARYASEHNEPEKNATSGLSPYLARGHISTHEVFRAIARREKWTAKNLGCSAGGKRRGWWGMSGNAEAFLDELVTWREVGFNMCSKWDNYDRYASLPFWARSTLEKHAGDPREYTYTASQLGQGLTHDALWNAAQVQLLREGRIHNYVRMLWGKKILEWTGSPKHALKTMIDLNNKYAIDGRDPNSYTGIFWVLGRYDRPWGPERPVFGKIRYMSSDNTARKYAVRNYIERYKTE